MKVILFILQKEFKQIFRNKGMLPIIFVVPIIQLLILANAATFEIKDLGLYIIDKDQSSLSKQLIHKFGGSQYFKISGSAFSSSIGDKALEEGSADLVIEIPAGFERDLMRESRAKIQLIINAIDGQKAGLSNAYANSVIADFNQNIRLEYGSPNGFSRLQLINMTFSPWYNIELDYKNFMVPGILVLLVTMIGSFLSSMNVVREKEIGTIEQLNVTPIKKHQFIIGKLFPFWFLALFELGLGLVVGKLFYDFPIVGSIPLLFFFAGIYLMVVLGFGLFISTVTETQQQAMFISWFVLVVFILMSGFFTPIENMPDWAQYITYFNPVRYFMEVVRMVLLKGAGLFEIRTHIGIMIIFAIVINGLAMWRYRKTVA